MRGDWAKSYHRTGGAARKNPGDAGLGSLLLKQADRWFGSGSLLISHLRIYELSTNDACEGCHGQEYRAKAQKSAPACKDESEPDSCEHPPREKT